MTLDALRRDYCSFGGRLPRLAYWLRSFVSAIVCGAIMLIAVSVDGLSRTASIALIAIALGLSVVVWMTLVVRRFQDHGRNGWIGLAGVVSAAALAYVQDGAGAPTVFAILAGAVSLVLFIYLGFVRGTRGPNVYGPDPLAE